MTGGETMDEIELLRRHAGDPPPPTDEAQSDARAALSAAIERELGAHDAAGSRWTSWRLRAGAVAALAALAIVLGAALHSGSTGGPPPAAAAVLTRLAEVAAAQPSDVPAPGRFLYSASRSLSESDTGLPGGRECVVVFSQYRQNWIATDGKGLFRETDGPSRYLSPQARHTCRSAPYGGAISAGVSNTWAARGCLSISPIPLASLPTDPTTLRARLLTGKVEGGPRGPAEAFAQVGDLLRETDASPALRAALYRAAAGLDGVRYLGMVTDEVGQRGQALAIDGHGIRHELIFAPRTSALIAERDVVIASTAHAPRLRVGTVADWTAYTAMRVVSQLPERSPLPLRPACLRTAGRVLSIPGRPDDAVIVGTGDARIRSR
jgi:hypothetical protein